VLYLPIFVGASQGIAAGQEHQQEHAKSTNQNQQVARGRDGTSVWAAGVSRAAMGPDPVVVPNGSMNIYEFLRFSSDGKVVGTEFATPAALAEVEDWDFFKVPFADLFGKARALNDPSLFFGEYSISGSSIKFSLTYPNGPAVDYDGTIQGSSLQLNFVSRDKSNAGKESYELLSPKPVKK